MVSVATAGEVGCTRALTLVGLAGVVELLERLGQLAVVLAVEEHLAELEVGLEPQPVVLCLLQRLERRLVKLQQQVGLLGQGCVCVLGVRQARVRSGGGAAPVFFHSGQPPPRAARSVCVWARACMGVPRLHRWRQKRSRV